MPSGHTHDRITFWSVPLVAGCTGLLSHSPNLTLLASGGFLFGGLMFGPDLDIYSRQYQRWGWLRWIWLPYRRLFAHRSFWSHGAIVGTALRLLYLTLWVVAIGGLGLAAATQLALIEPNWQTLSALLGRALQQHGAGGIAFYLGVELGAISHSVSDWLVSTYKRLNKHGFKGFRHHPVGKKRLTKGRRKPKSKRSKE